MNNKLIISNVVKELGISANLKGYRYIICGVELIMNNISLMDSTMGVYKGVGKEFNVTPNRVERAIRHAIESGWNKANSTLVKKMFGCSVDSRKGKPANSEFLATVADYLLMTGGEE